jgi:uncharacterized protein YjiS (DUF1127 family)
MTTYNLHAEPDRRQRVSLSAILTRSSMLRRVGRGILRPVRRIAQYRKDQQAYEHLLHLPDYLLHDVGLTRDAVLHAQSNSLRMRGIRVPER